LLSELIFALLAFMRILREVREVRLREVMVRAFQRER
jgi:hypothetical protein